MRETYGVFTRSVYGTCGVFTSCVGDLGLVVCLPGMCVTCGVCDLWCVYRVCVCVCVRPVACLPDVCLTRGVFTMYACDLWCVYSTFASLCEC